MEVQRLNTTTSLSVITQLKSMFSRFGIPAELVTDNCPQFDSADMMTFFNSYGFQHIKTSPHYPQANGLAERMVKTVKAIMKNSTDPYMALLSYCATPMP